MHWSTLTNTRAVLALAALFLLGASGRAQTTGTNPGSTSGSYYPYWSSAPSSYRGETMRDPRGFEMGYSISFPSPLAGSSFGVGMMGLAGSSYLPRPGQYSFSRSFPSSMLGYYSPSALAEAATLFAQNPAKKSDDTAQDEVAQRQHHGGVGADVNAAADACRAGTTTRFFTGDAPASLKGYAYVSDEALRKKLGEPADPTVFFPFDDGYPFTAPVARFKPNPWGLHDMLGNVFQWCADEIPGESPKRVLRGGSYNTNVQTCRCAARGFGKPWSRYSYTGFRIVLGP